ncbi:hypothetical protein D9M68_940460 [compost metagenome]
MPPVDLVPRRNAGAIAGFNSTHCGRNDLDCRAFDRRSIPYGDEHFCVHTICDQNANLAALEAGGWVLKNAEGV